jgi:ABC-2 type transport system permease protein
VTSASLRGRPGGFTSGTDTLNVGERVRRIYVYRRILGLLVRRDLKVRYAGSALGYVWTILDPLLMTLTYWLIFTQIFHRTAGPEFKPYVLYLVTGQLPWFWFSGAVTATAKALRSESQMVRSSNVPRELWVLRTVLSKGVEYIFGLPILAIFALAYLTGPTKYIVLMPLAWLLELTLLLGIGLILAPLTVLVKDVNRIIPVVLRIFYYMSPVLYSITRLPPKLQILYQFNPTTGFLELSHAAFFPAAIQHHYDYVWHSALWAVGVLAIGIFVFTRLERAVLKEI